MFIDEHILGTAGYDAAGDVTLGGLYPILNTVVAPVLLSDARAGISNYRIDPILSVLGNLYPHHLQVSLQDPLLQSQITDAITLTTIRREFGADLILDFDCVERAVWYIRAAKFRDIKAMATILEARPSSFIRPNFVIEHYVARAWVPYEDRIYKVLWRDIVNTKPAIKRMLVGLPQQTFVLATSHASHYAVGVETELSYLNDIRKDILDTLTSLERPKTYVVGGLSDIAAAMSVPIEIVRAMAGLMFYHGSLSKNHLGFQLAQLVSNTNDTQVVLETYRDLEGRINKTFCDVTGWQSVDDHTWIVTPSAYEDSIVVKPIYNLNQEV